MFLINFSFCCVWAKKIVDYTNDFCNQLIGNWENLLKVRLYFIEILHLEMKIKLNNSVVNSKQQQQQ